MNILDEICKQVRQEGLRRFGEEGMEQLDLDYAFLEEKFGDLVLYDLEASRLAIILGKDPDEIIASSFLSGVYTYREFVRKHGIDVLSLEGRV